jgi:putative ABC transport system permease protein
MLNTRLIRRQIAGSLHQSVVFILCVVLSMVTLVSLSGFSRSVHASFLRDAQSLHAADIIIHSHAPLSDPIVKTVAGLERKGAIKSAAVEQFYSVVRAFTEESSLLAELKVAAPGYPFYGTVVTASGRPFNDVLASGNVIVEQTLLDRMNVKIGDRLKVGSATLVIRDVVLLEPDRPVNFFSLGPRVFVSSADLAGLKLIDKGSRVNYTLLVKVRDQKELESIAEQLRGVAVKYRERVETFKTADSGMKRFFDNFLFFLNLIGIFTLLLAGIGIQSSLAAFLKEQEGAIAVMKAVGATSRFIIMNYFTIVTLLGLFGTVFGIAASFLFVKVLPSLFQGILPAGMDLSIPPAAVIEGLVLGGLVVNLFTLLPLFRLKDVKPSAIFSKEERSLAPGKTTWLFGLAGAVFFLIMILWRINEMKTGLYFVLGVGLLILLSFGCTETMLLFMIRLKLRNLVPRQAVKGLFRPRNATRAVMVTLTAALAVIFSITLVEKNLDATFVQSYPADAPNLFFIDIQPVQKSGFLKELGSAAVFYPVVRGTILSVNDETIDREKEHEKRGDNLGREFSLTYRDDLLDDERVIAGSGLFRKDWRETQVSVLDTVIKMHDMKPGDFITFRIQGIPLKARISSIRTRTRAGLQPFFYFVFPEETLKDAPQTLFTALRVEKTHITAIQNRIVAHFPNISVIDVTETISVFSKIMERLSTIVRFFTSFSVVAGILIIISSVIATRHSRIQEAVFFKILGARSRFVLAVFASEGLFLGLSSGLLALAFSQTAAWFICWKVLELAYRPFFGLCIMLVIAMTVIVMAVGLAASVPVLRKRPAAFLREQAEE